jgi:hypothetical protein
MEQLDYRWTGFYETCWFSIFRKSLEKIQVFFLIVARIKGALYEDLRTFMIISRIILLRMRNISDKICRENQNTYIFFSIKFKNLFP